MAAGDRWATPEGHQAIEMPGSTSDVLKLAVIVPGWPWPTPPVDAPRALCEAMPSRYLQGAIPKATA